MIDIGSGNGFPGIVLAIVSADTKVHLVEVDTRKAEFLKHVKFKVGLGNASVLNKKVQIAGVSDKPTAISRAFADIGASLEMADALFAPGFRYFHMKSENWEEEWKKSSPVLQKKWRISVAGNYELPDNQTKRKLILSEKIA